MDPWLTLLAGSNNFVLLLCTITSSPGHSSYPSGIHELLPARRSTSIVHDLDHVHPSSGKGRSTPARTIWNRLHVPSRPVDIVNPTCSLRDHRPHPSTRVAVPSHLAPPATSYRRHHTLFGTVAREENPTHRNSTRSRIAGPHDLLWHRGGPSSTHVTT